MYLEQQILNQILNYLFISRKPKIGTSEQTSKRRPQDRIGALIFNTPAIRRSTDEFWEIWRQASFDWKTDAKH